MSRNALTAFGLAVVDRVPGTLAARIGNSDGLKKVIRPALNRLAPDDYRVVTVKSGRGKGLALEIDVRNEKFYWTGTYETTVQEAIAWLLRPGDCFWDIGGHIGFMSLIAAKIVGPTGSVHTFEPHPANFRRLQRNVALNSMSCVHTHDIAIAGTTGSAVFEPASSTSMGRLADHESQTGFDVRTLSLDDAVSQYGTPKLIKIDAEGSEATILRAGASLLAAQTTAFLLEDHHRASSHLHAYLSGYEVEPLSDRHVLSRPHVNQHNRQLIGQSAEQEGTD